MKIPVNKEKLNKFIVKEPSDWITQADYYETNKDWLDKSALIAVRILTTLKRQSMTQKALAESIGVTPQYINKVVKGSENLSLETISKIEKILGITLITVPMYDVNLRNMNMPELVNENDAFNYKKSKK